nr:hypothetical protein [Macrococcus caseolyticus]
MGDDRERVNHGVSGDIMGVYDCGKLEIGDRVVGGKEKLEFEKLGELTGEMFMKV